MYSNLYIVWYRIISEKSPHNIDDYPKFISELLNSKGFISVCSDSIYYVKVEEESIESWYNVKNNRVSHIPNYSPPDCNYLIIQFLPSVTYGESRAIITVMPQNRKYISRISKSYDIEYLFDYYGDFYVDYNQLTTYHNAYEAIINAIINSEQFNDSYNHPQVVFIENELMPIFSRLTFVRNGVEAVIKKKSEIGILVGDFTIDIDNPQTARVQLFLPRKVLNFRLELINNLWVINTFNEQER